MVIFHEISILFFTWKMHEYEKYFQENKIQTWFSYVWKFPTGFSLDGLSKSNGLMIISEWSTLNGQVFYAVLIYNYIFWCWGGVVNLKLNPLTMNGGDIDFERPHGHVPAWSIGIPSYSIHDQHGWGSKLSILWCLAHESTLSQNLGQHHQA